MMAAYNRWANVRLYDMAAALPDELYRKSIDIYFKNLHGTLNHILTADRIWMCRLEGKGDHPSKLNAILYEDMASLRTARLAEDQRIVSFVDNLDDADFGKAWEFHTLNGTPQRKYVRDILAHMFNHQTHHRGQAHAALTLLGVSEPAPLDLLIMLNQ
jgi:uncharacterized damage-inducible protein DinB